MSAISDSVAPTFVAVLLLAAWQALHLAAGADLISSPVETAALLVHLMRTTRFWLDVGETGLAFVWALILSTLFGVLLGVLLGLNRLAGDIVEPILVTFYSLPKVTLYPIVLLGFGLGMPAKVAFGVMHGLVPIMLLTRNAITQLNPVYWRTARVFELTHVDTIRWVILPAIVPELVAGIRIGFSLSLLGVLIGEMFASKRGLGFAAVSAMGLGDVKTILAIGVFVSIFTMVVNMILLGIERSTRLPSK